MDVGNFWVNMKHLFQSGSDKIHSYSRLYLTYTYNTIAGHLAIKRVYKNRCIAKLFLWLDLIATGTRYWAMQFCAMGSWSKLNMVSATYQYMSRSLLKREVENVWNLIRLVTSFKLVRNKMATTKFNEMKRKHKYLNWKLKQWKTELNAVHACTTRATI